ncbi:hypothetical protein CEXT_324731, partial [Caerostris extrusa]
MKRKDFEKYDDDDYHDDIMMMTMYDYEIQDKNFEHIGELESDNDSEILPNFKDAPDVYRIIVKSCQ